MLNRILEPEVMDSLQEAIDYDQMDHGPVNRLFAADLLAAMADDADSFQPGMHIFDAGTGTAQIPIELKRLGFPGTVVASDLAAAMLEIATQNVQAAGLAASITLTQRDCKNLSDPDATYDAVISNSIVHHIPEPRLVLREMWRVLKPGGLLFVRDLMRPDTSTALDTLVNLYAGEANELQRQMFRESLHAALTLAEVRQLLAELGVDENAVRQTSDRHWTISLRKPLA